MSWRYGAPGGYQGSPYATNLPSASSTNSQGRSTYAQVASTSANPYNHLPHPQNPTPPVRSASFYRPPTTTIRSSVQINRPAYPNPALMPSFAPPPQFLQYNPVPSTSSAPLPPAEVPPPPSATERSTLEKITIPSTEETESQTGGGKKKKKKKRKKEKADETKESMPKPADSVKKVQIIDEEERARGTKQKLYLNSIVVTGSVGQLTSIRRLDSLESPLVNPERFLSRDEKKDMNHYQRNLYKAVEQKERRQRLAEKMGMQGNDERQGISGNDEGEVELDFTTVVQDSAKSSEIPNQTSEPPTNTFLSLEVFVRPYFEEINHLKLEQKRVAKLEREAAKVAEVVETISQQLTKGQDTESGVGTEIEGSFTEEQRILETRMLQQSNTTLPPKGSISSDHTGEDNDDTQVTRLEAGPRVPHGKGTLPSLSPEVHPVPSPSDNESDGLRSKMAPSPSSRLTSTADTQNSTQSSTPILSTVDLQQNPSASSPPLTGLAHRPTQSANRKSVQQAAESDKEENEEPSNDVDDTPRTRRSSKTFSTRYVAPKVGTLKAFTSSIFVLGAPEKITSIIQLASTVTAVDRGYRALNVEELKSLSDLAKAARKNSRSRFKSAKRNALLSQKSFGAEQDEDLGSKEGGDARGSNGGNEPPTETDTSDSAIGQLLNEDPTDTPEEPQYLSLLDYAQDAINEIVRKDEAKRTDSRLRDLAEPPQPESKLKGSETGAKIAPPVREPLIESSSLSFISSFPQISISPLPQSLPSQIPSLVPASVEDDSILEPSFDNDIVVPIQEGALEGTPSKEGEDEMGSNEICELEVKKESVDVGEDLGAIKEEEATLSTREELPQSVQQSNSHAELSPTRIEPQATLASLESGIQVEEESEVGDHLEVRRQEVGDTGGEVTTDSNENVLPSSDLSEVDEEAIAESGSEDSAAESITEVLAKRKASSTSIVRPEKKRSKLLPDYLDELLEEEENYTLWWDDPSVSASAKVFVLEREKIFALQRSFVDLEKQQAATQVVTSQTGTVAKTTLRSYLSVLAGYLSFCDIAKLPPFPITSAMIALYLYQYRAQWPEVDRGRNPQALRFFARRIAHLFDNQSEAYKQLDSWHESDLLIRELRKPIETTKSSVSTRSDARRNTATSTSTRASPAISSKPVSGRPNLKKSQARSTSSQFELVIPDRRDQRRVERPSKSPMMIESSISFTSAKPATSRELRNIPVPEIGQRFKSLRAVKMSTAVAVIYSQGYTIGTSSNSDSTAISIYCEGPGPAEKGCDFRVHASLDSSEEEWVIDGCINDHSHEPSQTLQHVEWRPSTIDPDLIQAMYQIDRKGQLDESLRKLVTTKRSTEVSHDEEQPNKRIRTHSPPLSERTISEQPSLAHAPIPPQSSVEPLRRATSPSPSLNEKPLLSNSISFRAPFTNLPPRSESFASSLPPQRSPDDPFYKSVEVPQTIAATSPLLDLSNPPAPQLIFFLKSLDSSLAPLAPLLHASGYTTLDSLVELSAIGVEARNRMYREIFIRGGKVESRLFELLERKLVEASEGDWKD